MLYISFTNDIKTENKIKNINNITPTIKKVKLILHMQEILQHAKTRLDTVRYLLIRKKKKRNAYNIILVRYLLVFVGTYV